MGADGGWIGPPLVRDKADGLAVNRQRRSILRKVFDLAPFALSDMIAASAALRDADNSATCMEEAAGAIVRYLADHLIDKATSTSACALVRLYKLHPYAELPSDVQAAARRAVVDDSVLLDEVNCLVQLASVGIEEGWNDRRASQRHQAIPLPSAAALRRLPMVAALLSALQIDHDWVVGSALTPIGTNEDQPYDVFHVPDARNCPSVPDQEDFVIPYGIRSVVGFGGVLPSGSMFAVVVFSTVSNPREAADLFGPLALAAKVALLPFDGGRIFADEPPASSVMPVEVSLAAQVTALRQLLQVRETMVGGQTAALESTLTSLEERSEQLSETLSALATSDARHQALINASIDAVVSMDADGDIVTFNPAAERIFGYQRDAALGQPLDQLLIPLASRDDHRHGLRRYLRDGIGPILGRHVELNAMRADGSEFPVELTVNAVELPGIPTSFTATIRDITMRIEAQNRLREARQHSGRIARTLQESLLPPQLPAIPGVELGTTYHPAGDGSEIGGDFYDVFQTGRDDWVLVLGDVCGKGSAAAAVTALARYTLRATAMRVRRPSAVLGVLNEALLTQQSDRYCTVVYVRLRQRGDKIRLTISAGGHPLPLLVAPDGSLRTVGRPGTLVGVIPDAEFIDQSVDLPAGHTLVTFTDGVTEARRDGQFFGDHGLRQVLAAVASSPAPQIAASVQEAVMAYQDGDASDDLAVLTVRCLPDRLPGD